MGSIHSLLSSLALNMKNELAKGGRHRMMIWPQARMAHRSAAITATTGAYPRYSIGKLHSDFRSSNLKSKKYSVYF